MYNAPVNYKILPHCKMIHDCGGYYRGEKVAKRSDSEGGGGQSVAMHGKGGPSASEGVESDVPPSNDGGDSVGGGDQSDALPSNMSNGGDDSAGGADKSDALPSNMSIGGDDSAVHDPENEGESQPLLLSSHQENKGNVKESMDGSLKRLKTCIEVFGRVDIQNNQGGGNCFFHAVVDQLEWLGILGQNSAKNLRIKLVEFLRQLQPDDPISGSLPASKHKRKEYLDKLAKDGTCVEAEDVKGTAKMLKCDLHVVVLTDHDHYVVDIKKGGTNGKRLSLGLVDQHYISLRSYYNRQAGVGAKPIDQHRAQQLDPSSSVQPKPSNKAQAQQSLPPDSPSVKPKPGNNNQTQQSGPSSSIRPNPDSRAHLQPQQSVPGSPIESPNPEFYKSVKSYPAFELGSIKQLDSSCTIRPEIINSKEGM
ncbi:uncharacterized protein LOC119743288 [Patiria miniata]|uniref:OTU domain-containing protein n=1 Tax=Patiria miniata TaxID=46514 RepID=A0A914BHP9_PATMI|nr:uncharacterized protein LOC119743288 [Patiria miniata]